VIRNHTNYKSQGHKIRGKQHLEQRYEVTNCRVEGVNNQSKGKKVCNPLDQYMFKEAGAEKQFPA
jgi:hypothetical protein